MRGVKSRLANAVGMLLGLHEKSIEELSAAEREKLIKWLYDVLSILDAKTAHVVSTSSISLAAQTFLVGLILNGKVQFPILPANAEKVFLVGSLLVPLFASVKALGVYQVEWRFFEKYLDEEGNADLRKEIEDLGRTAETRTLEQWHARRYSLWAVATLASIVVLATFWELKRVLTP